MSAAPKRIQRRRTKGWRMPENAVYVGRGSRWGNPFKVERCACCGYWEVRDENDVTYLIDHAVARQHPEWANDREEAHREAAALFGSLYVDTGRLVVERDEADLEPLRGKDLACWCPPEFTCHADVLLELANPREE